MRALKLALLLGTSAVCGVAASFGAVTYTQTSGTGLNTSTATLPAVLDDINLAAATFSPQTLSAMTFGYGVLAGTTAQTGAVFVDFYDTFTPASTSSVVSDYIGGFGGTITIAANTGATTALRANQFTNLNTLATPIVFKDNNFAVVVTFTDSTGANYSTVLTPLMSNPGTPTVGTSTAGVYRDTNGDGTFQSTELNTALGNYYLSLTTIAAVPEPSSVALLGFGGVAMLGGVYRLRRRQA